MLKLIVFTILLIQPSEFLFSMNVDSMWNEVKSNKNDTLKCKTLIRMSDYYGSNNLDSLLILAEELKRLSTKLGFTKYIITSHNIAGVAYRQKNQLDKSVYEFLLALEMGIKHKFKDREMFTRLDLGNVYTKQKLYDKSIECLKIGLNIAQERKDTIWMVNYYNNINLNLSEMGLIDSVYKNNLYCLDLMGDQYLNDVNYFDIMINLSSCCINLEKYNEAIIYSEKVLRYGISNSMPFYSYFGAINAGNAYHKLKKLTEAEKYYNDAINYLKQTYDPVQESKLYYNLANLYLDQNRTELGRDYLIKYVVLKDSLAKSTYLSDITKIETQYKVKEKEAVILEQKNNLLAQRMINYGMIGLILLATFIFIVIYQRYRNKQKSLLQDAIIKEQKIGINAVIEAQENERRRVAQELHDGIAQSLVALQLGYQSLVPKISNNNNSHIEYFNELNNRLNDSCTEVRNLSHTMSPQGLEKKGINSALHTLFQNSLLKSKISYELHLDQLPDNLDIKKTTSIYRIIQELIQNIIKHSQATKVILHSYLLKDKLIIRLEDNGIGFKFNEELEKGSMGLLNILSRVKNLNGEYEVESTFQGTASVIRLPINN